MRLVGDFGAAHATAQHVEQHVAAPDGGIIGFAHELAEQCQFLFGNGETGAAGVHGHLGDAFQDFVAVAADVKLPSVLEVRVVVLESLFGGIDNGIVDIVQSQGEVFFVLGKAGAVYPVQGNVCAVGSGPFGRMASVLAYSVQRLGFQFGRNLFLAGAQLYQHDAQALGFGNLVVPPVVAPRVPVVPVFKPFHYLVKESFVSIIAVSGSSISECKIIQSVYVQQWRPVCTLYARIVHVGEGAVGFIVGFQCFFCLFCRRIDSEVLSDFFHKYLILVVSLGGVGRCRLLRP